MLAKHGFREFEDKVAQPVQLSLFPQALPTREECLAKAYKIQGDKIAYVEKNGDYYEIYSQSVSPKRRLKNSLIPLKKQELNEL